MLLRARNDHWRAQAYRHNRGFWTALLLTLATRIQPSAGTLWRFPSATIALTLLVARSFFITLSRMRLSVLRRKGCALHDTLFLFRTSSVTHCTWALAISARPFIAAALPG